MREYLAIGLTSVLVAIGSFFGVSKLLDGRPAEPVVASTKNAQSLLGSLIECRKAARPDCGQTAAGLAKLVIEGDNKFFKGSAASNFGVYVQGANLVYVKKNCTRADIEIDLFALNAWPKNVAHLTPDRRQFGFGSFDFSFAEHGYLAQGYCLALYTLPFEDVVRAVTGQYVRGPGFLWQVDLKI